LWSNWPDLKIAREKLHHCLAPEERYIADGGYQTHTGDAMTPGGHSWYYERMKSLARALQETANRRFKSFGILDQRCRHDVHLHSLVFHAIANITQLRILTGDSTLFKIDYDEY
jgi:hypothetical protein